MVYAVTVIGIITHVTVVRAFEPKQTRRSFNCTRNFIVAKFHNSTFFVNHLYGDVRSDAVAGLACLDCPRTAQAA